LITKNLEVQTIRLETRRFEPRERGGMGGVWRDPHIGRKTAGLPSALHFLNYASFASCKIRQQSSAWIRRLQNVQAMGMR
jgi:hypothetical protein